jgi:Domain of unknown function (DUF4413)
MLLLGVFEKLHTRGNGIGTQCRGMGATRKSSKICRFFFKATVQLSCLYSPTSFELLKHLYSISKVYRELEQAETRDKSLTPIVDAMKQKFLKYWEDIPLLAIIVSCLNPAYKKYYTIRMIQAYKDNLHLSNTGVEAYVNSKFDAMFNIYNSRWPRRICRTRVNCPF